MRLALLGQLGHRRTGFPHLAGPDDGGGVDGRGASGVAARGGSGLLPSLPPTMVVRQAHHPDAAAQRHTCVSSRAVWHDEQHSQPV